MSIKCTAKFVKVTPKMAIEWLATTVKNRRLKDQHVQQLSHDMRTKRWKQNGESIKFDWDDHLMDGQHRLHAVVRADEPFVFLVVRGLDPKSFDTLDNQATRKYADVLSAEGEKSTTLLSSALGILANYHLNRGTFRQGFTMGERASTLALFPDVREAVNPAHSLYRNCAFKLMPPGPVVFCYYAFRKADPKKAEEFFNQAWGGLNLVSGTPCAVLKKSLESKANRFKSIPSKMALVVKAWNAFVEGDSIQALRFLDKTEAFPNIVGYPPDKNAAQRVIIDNTPVDVH